MKYAWKSVMLVYNLGKIYSSTYIYQISFKASYPPPHYALWLYIWLPLPTVKTHSFLIATFTPFTVPPHLSSLLWQTFQLLIPPLPTLKSLKLTELKCSHHWTPVRLSAQMVLVQAYWSTAPLQSMVLSIIYSSYAYLRITSLQSGGFTPLYPK